MLSPMGSMSLLTFPQSMCHECDWPCVSISGSSIRSRCYVSFSRYPPSHVRTLLRRRPGSPFLEQPLTLQRTIEEVIGLMCTCMPFFPVIVSNSPTIQRYIHSVASLGSGWSFRSSHNGSITGGRKSYRKHVSRDGSVEDGLELYGRDEFTNKALPESPKKTPRMEPGAFEGNVRPDT